MVLQKRNLLQRVRIVFTALVTILGFGGAMAMKSESKQVAQTYGVYSQTTGHYRVTQNPVVPSNYDCNMAISTICTVQAEITPTETSPGSGVYQLSKNDASAGPQGRFEE